MRQQDIEYLKKEGLPVYIWGGGDVAGRQKTALERNGIFFHPDRIFTNSEVGESKHSRKIYDMASQSMGSSSEETLVIEDSLYALKTAKAAGYITAGVYDPDGESDQDGIKNEADIYLLSLPEIYPYIKSKRRQL